MVLVFINLIFFNLFILVTLFLYFIISFCGAVICRNIIKYNVKKSIFKIQRLNENMCVDEPSVDD